MRVRLSVLAMVLACACASEVPEPMCSAWSRSLHFAPPERSEADLLLVVGNAPTEEEHARRAAALTRLIEIYATGDWDGDGAPDGPEDFDAVDDLHVWVVSSHLGSGGFPVAGCEPYSGGDSTRFSGGSSECGTGGFLALRTDRGESSAAFVDAFECLLRYEPSCEIEQPLEAALWALSSGSNEGFLRDNSDLLIMVATTGDDCSASDQRLFTLADPYESASIEVACAAFESEALHPVQHYVDAFLAQRWRPALLGFQAIAGIPEDLAPALGESADYAVLTSEDPAVRDDRMEPTVDPLDPARLSPACESSLGARALPALRIAQVARELEAQGAAVGIGSVCSEGYETSWPVYFHPREPRWPICLRAWVPRRPDGSVACDIDLAMPPGISCDDTPGAVASGEPTQDGRAICTWTQLVPSDDDRSSWRAPDGFGWFLDDYSDLGLAECGDVFAPDEPYQWLAFTASATPGAVARFRCDAQPWVASSCSSTTPCQSGAACDPIVERCGVPCGDDFDCAIAGLDDHECDDRRLEEIDPVRFEGDDRLHELCVPRACP